MFVEHERSDLTMQCAQYEFRKGSLGDRKQFGKSKNTILKLNLDLF